MNADQQRLDEFRKLFNEFEKVIKIENNCGPKNSIGKLIDDIAKKKPSQHCQTYRKRNFIIKHYGFIKLCIDIRNLYSHESELDGYQRNKQKSIRSHYSHIISPSEELMNDLKKFVDDFKKPQIKFLQNLFVPRNEIFTVTHDDTISQKLKDMSERLFSHAPILNDEKVVGILDIEFLTKILSDEDGELLLTRNLKLENYNRFLGLNEQIKLGAIKFMSLNDTYEDLYQAFQQSINNEKRLTMVLFTDSGSKNGKLEGLCTIWDVFKTF